MPGTLLPPDTGAAGDPASPAARVFSPTGLQRFNRCEKQFVLYPDRDKSLETNDKSPALVLGTEVHELLQARFLGQDWRALLPERARLLVPAWDDEWDLPERVDTARWLLERHEIVYPTLPRTQGVEQHFEFQVPDGPVVQGYMDGLVLVDGRWWLLEIKTMGDWKRLDWLQWDRQLGTYLWAADQLGLDLAGVMYEAILTTRWKTAPDKPKGHPVTDSFQRLMLPRARFDGLVKATLQDYRQAWDRYQYVQGVPTLARRNAGENCKYCRVREACDPAGVWI